MALDRSLGVGIVIGASLGSGAVRAFQSTAERSTRLGDALRRTERSAVRLGATQRRLRTEQERTGDSSGKLARDLDRVGRKMDQLTRSGAAARRELRLLGQVEVARQRRDSALRGGAAALGIGYGVSRLIGQEFERERVELAIGHLADRDVAAGAAAHSRGDVRAGRVLHSEAELLEVQYQLLGADLPAEVARLGSTMASKVATVTRGVPADVSSVMGDAFTMFGDQFGGGVEEKLGAVSDILTRTQQKFKFSTFGDLGDGLKESAAQAVAAQLPFEQTTVALGVLSLAGHAGSRGGTALQAVLRNLPRAAKQFGFETVRTADGALQLGATLQGLKARLDDIDDIDEKNIAIQQAFGEEGSKGLIPMLGRLDQLEAYLADVSSYDMLDEQHQQQLDAASGRAVILGNNLAALGNVMSSVLLPAVTPVVVGTTAVASWFGELVESSPLLGATLRVVAGAAGILTGAIVVLSLTRWGWSRAKLGALDMGRTIRDTTARVTGLNWAAAGTRAMQLGSTLAGWGRGLLGFLSPVKLAAAATWVWNAALAANPIVWVVGAVVAGAALIGGAAYLIYKHWEPIKSFFAGLLGAVLSVFKPAVKAWAAVFTDFSWANIGKAIIETLTLGLTGNFQILYKGVGFVMGKVRGLLPFSDAREGPLAGLTASGGAILRTMGEGVRRAGPRPLVEPLGRQFAAASTALALSVPAAAAAAPGGPGAGAGVYNDYRSYRITIVQQAGEDASALADRLMAEIRRRDEVRRRALLRDEI